MASYSVSVISFFFSVTHCSFLLISSIIFIPLLHSLLLLSVSSPLGLGKALLVDIIERSENSNIWLIQSGIFPENTASIKLHSTKVGFREVGIREKVGMMLIGEHKGKWRDIILFERRSTVVGVNC
jgi:L-amino acid N-acyltransferase YncA